MSSLGNSAPAPGLATPPHRGQRGLKSQTSALGRVAASAVTVPGPGGAGRTGSVLLTPNNGRLGTRLGSMSSNCTGGGQRSDGLSEDNRTNVFVSLSTENPSRPREGRVFDIQLCGMRKGFALPKG